MTQTLFHFFNILRLCDTFTLGFVSFDSLQIDLGFSYSSVTGFKNLCGVSGDVTKEGPDGGQCIWTPVLQVIPVGWSSFCVVEFEAAFELFGGLTIKEKFTLWKIFESSLGLSVGPSRDNHLIFICFAFYVFIFCIDTILGSLMILPSILKRFQRQSDVS